MVLPSEDDPAAADALRALESEIDFMRELQHRHIVRKPPGKNNMLQYYIYIILRYIYIIYIQSLLPLPLSPLAHRACPPSLAAFGVRADVAHEDII